jgi:hypothetical protein
MVAEEMGPQGMAAEDMAAGLLKKWRRWVGAARVLPCHPRWERRWDLFSIPSLQLDVVFDDGENSFYDITCKI